MNLATLVPEFVSLGFVAPFLLKGAVLLLVVLAAAKALSRAPSATRKLVLVVGLLGLLALPLLEVAVPWRIGVLPEVTAEIRVHPDAWTAEGGRGPMDPGAASVDVAMPAAGGLDWTALLGLVWLAGAAAFALRLARAWIRMAGVVRRGRPLGDPGWTSALRAAARTIPPGRPVELIESTEVRVPMTTGWLRPAVLLPVSARSWSKARQRTVLLHELVHVRRWDLAIHTLARFACALH